MDCRERGLISSKQEAYPFHSINRNRCYYVGDKYRAQFPILNSQPPILNSQFPILLSILNSPKPTAQNTPFNSGSVRFGSVRNEPLYIYIYICIRICVWKGIKERRNERRKEGAKK